MLRLYVIALALALAACSSPQAGSSPPPNTVETAPATNDPGAIAPTPAPGAPVDTTPTPTSTPITSPPEPNQSAGGGATPTPGGGMPGSPRPDGASCLDAAECASGVCEGQGCTADKPGTCASKQRACTRDLRPYCGCDGKTFRTSGSCPGKRFSARAECP